MGRTILEKRKLQLALSSALRFDCLHASLLSHLQTRSSVYLLGLRGSALPQTCISLPVVTPPLPKFHGFPTTCKIRPEPVAGPATGPGQTDVRFSLYVFFYMFSPTYVLFGL